MLVYGPVGGGEVALIAAGGDDRGLAHAEDARVGVAVLGVLHGYGPVRAVGLRAQGLDVPAQGDDGALDALRGHGLGGVFGGAALCNAGEGQLRAVRQRHEIAVGVAHRAHRELVEADVLEEARNLVAARHAVGAVDKAPGLDKRIDREVERPARASIYRARRREHLGHLPRNQRPGRAGVVYAPGLGALNLGIQHGVERVYDVLRRRKPGLSVLPVGREAHDRVHGENLRVMPLVLAAARERKRRHSRQQQRRGPFYVSLHKIHLGSANL